MGDDLLLRIRTALSSVPPADPAVLAAAERRMEDAREARAQLSVIDRHGVGADRPTLGRRMQVGGWRRPGQLVALSAIVLSVVIVLGLITFGGNARHVVTLKNTSTTQTTRPTSRAAGISFPRKTPRNFTGNYAYGPDVINRTCANPGMISEAYWQLPGTLSSQVANPAHYGFPKADKSFYGMFVWNSRDVREILRVLCALPALTVSPYSYEPTCAAGKSSSSSMPLGTLLFWSKSRGLLGGVTLYERDHCQGVVVWPTRAPFPPSPSTPLRTFEGWFRAGSEKVYAALARLAAFVEE